MNGQKSIKILGFFLLIFSIVFMLYKFINESGGDKMYIVYGLLMTSIGVILVSYGEKKKEM